MKFNKLIMSLAAAAMSLTAMAQSQTVQFFAHRASRFEFDENTLPAFKACYDLVIREILPLSVRSPVRNRKKISVWPRTGDWS